MESLPDVILDDILIRLPLKSLLACIFVCKEWKTMIYDEKFKDGYLLRSMTRPMDPTPASLFHSVCQQQIYEITAPIRGVVCLLTSTRVLLCNPITNNVLLLPDIEGRGLVYPFHTLSFGYDEATSVFKVIWQKASNRYLVYTVGGEGSWRTIACDAPHFMATRALCKGGVLYYAALTYPDLAPTIISFNVSSETFDYNQLPEGFIVDYCSTMVNYNGKVAVVTNLATELRNTEGFQICVRNEDSGQWELQQLVIPGWRDNVGNDRFFSFVGTIGTEDLVFRGVNDGSESVLYYNTNPPEGSSGFKMSRIEADNGGSYHYVPACFNHFDCLLRAN